MFYDFATTTRRSPGIASESDQWRIVGTLYFPRAKPKKWIKEAARKLLSAKPDIGAVAVFAARSGSARGRLAFEVYRDAAVPV